jgi:hypothetical protein
VSGHTRAQTQIAEFECFSRFFAVFSRTLARLPGRAFGCCCGRGRPRSVSGECPSSGTATFDAFGGDETFRRTLLRVLLPLCYGFCYGSDLNSAPILPRCYGCYGSRGGVGGVSMPSFPFPCLHHPSIPPRTARSLFFLGLRKCPGDCERSEPAWAILDNNVMPCETHGARLTFKLRLK